MTHAKVLAPRLRFSRELSLAFAAIAADNKRTMNANWLYYWFTFTRAASRAAEVVHR
jgi:hypothetical protein